tara:strand:- start:112 stop:636 length:525 start_codon:yes stop_codon:yes gene_type:complete
MKLLLLFLKKFIFIIFIIAFTYSCATSQNFISKGEIYSGMSKTSLRNLLLSVYPNEDPFIPGSFSEYNSLKSGEIISGSGKKIFYVFKNVNTPLDCGMFLCKYGNGTLKSWHYSLPDARASLISDKKLSNQEQPVISNIDEDDPVDDLNKLIKDFENGKITEEEFNEQKRNILN